MAPPVSALFVSVREPPATMRITTSLPLPVSVWPARSSATAFVIVNDPLSMAWGAQLAASVTVPPWSSSSWSAAHGVWTQFAM